MSRQPMRRPRYYPKPALTVALSTIHMRRREGDEIACSCGKRWPVGEEHP